MAVTSFATSSAALVIGTETFTDVNQAGTFVFEVDLSLMALGDIVILRAYIMNVTAGTARIAYEMRYYDAQPTDEQISVSPPVSNELTDATALRFSIQQTAGTGRAIPRKVLKHA